MSQRYIGGGVDLSHLANKAQTANSTGFALPGGAAVGAQTGGAGGGLNTVEIPAVVFEINEASFDNAAQLSNIVPVVLLLVDETDESQQMLNTLTGITRASGGKIVLGVIDAAANARLAQVFAPQAMPGALLMIAGQPQKLFEGTQQESALRQVYQQIVQLAASQGMTGQVAAQDLSGVQELPEEKVNPAHQKAIEAAERGDYATAVAEYDSVLLKSPRDAEAIAARAQISLLLRLQGKTAAAIRQAAVDDPLDTEAQLLVADLDISGGHVEDGFLRVLEQFARHGVEERKKIQERLLELFEVVGVADSRVSAARRQLANLLY
ncbi:tetratricopeptide repeat protein [Canibacter sp. lx-72]|uniref:tetratricopeptide repeat protein n=1 Tax=Canibacter zhuwentaonis TaxID=2837491 RepID=UPI001BDDB7D9|nr:tetratricopeptide repeat protein [Canibacter zhuwentaonis]MBT1017689.1 tetratricopeptide repeat protein [Canibacter zhuwentaonis]MBT1034843.1 tetratricopeptide repeat protein [Canibacter zhuwentaonis]